MNKTMTVFAVLLGATLFFNISMNYMADNIEDFENKPLPPKKVILPETHYPILKVDAQSRDTWTLVDFSSGKTYKIQDPEKDRNKLSQIDWDMGFQRTKIITNGGETNPSGLVEVANLGLVDFDSVDRVPSTGYVKDARAWGNITNKAIVDWYNYRTRTHNIESRKNVYVVRTSDGHVKMRILNYYCERPESDCLNMMCAREEAACLTIEYQYIPKGTLSFPILPEPSSQTAQAVVAK